MADYNTYLVNEYWNSKVNTDALYALCKAKGIDVDGDTPKPTPTPTPTPEPQPEPTPTPEPTPVTEHKLVYNGQSHYTIAPGESVTISVMDYNAESTRDVYCSISNEPSVVKHKTYEKKLDNGIKIDFVLTATNRGTSYFNTYLSSDKNNKDKWITVIVDVK